LRSGASRAAVGAGSGSRVLTVFRVGSALSQQFSFQTHARRLLA